MTQPTVPWLYEMLAHAYGAQDAWWPAESPFEICVGAILVQNTTWQQVARAIANLKSAMPRWDNHDNENQVRDTCRTVVPKVERLPVP